MNNGMRALAEAQQALPEPSTAQLPSGPAEYLRGGVGSPAAVLMSDPRIPSGSWALVLPALAELTTVVAVDPHTRPAGDQSEASLTGAALVHHTRTVLAAAGIQPPYVLVGHALGGLHANLWARLHPAEIAGVVLLESSHPEDDLYERRLRFLPRGLARASMAIGGSSARNAAERLLEQTSAELAAAGPFPPVPLTVISGARTGAGPTVSPTQAATHADRQQQLVALSPRGVQVVAPRSMFLPQITDPDLVVQAVQRVAAAG
jgi:pimeloyl-ACP methyl ester carboxylesterase